MASSDDARDPDWRLLAWWFLLPLAIFSLAQSRLQLYVLPLFVRIRSIAEHGCLPRSPDMFLNTRTTQAGWLARMTVAFAMGQIVGPVLVRLLGTQPWWGWDALACANALATRAISASVKTKDHARALFRTLRIGS